MAEESTRKLLRAFGVGVTNCEEALEALTAALRDPGAGTTPAAALETYGKAAADLSARWIEVSRLLLEYQARAHAAVQAFVGRRSAGEADPRPR
jgi:hypothetical protein